MEWEEKEEEEKKEEDEKKEEKDEKRNKIVVKYREPVIVPRPC